MRFAQIVPIASLLTCSTAVGCMNDVDAPPACPPGPPSAEVQVTPAGLEFVRTPDERFAGLADYPFEPHYVTIDGLRMHYVDEGPANGEPVVLLHGEPSWSYLYRRIIPVLAEAGYRVIAPDLIGMGRSDKPLDVAAHTYEGHVGWTWAFLEALELQGITLVAHDWGGLIGLRVVGDHPERFERVVAMNTALPVIPAGANPFVVPESTEVDCALGDFAPSDFQTWLEYALRAPDLRPSQILQAGTEAALSEETLAAYDAPYPSFEYKAAIRAFPSMITAVEEQNAPAWEALGAFDRPFLTLWGELDSNLGTQERQDALTTHVAGATDVNHERFTANHFLQEDVGPILGGIIAFFIQGTPPGIACWVPEATESTMDCDAVCDHILACNPGQSRHICVGGCELVTPYLTAEASTGVQPCMLEAECGTHANFGEALDGCMAPLIFGGTLETPPSHADICTRTAAAVTACDPENSFQMVCMGLAAVFDGESMARIGACADAPCDVLRDCLLEANCSYLYDNLGTLPDAP